MKYDSDKYSASRANIGVTVVPFIYENNVLKVLVYKRNENAEEFPHMLCLPNAFYDLTKGFTNLNQCAEYALAEKTNVKLNFIEQLATFSGDYIDPNRINTVNVAYFSLCRKEDIEHVGENSKFDSFWMSIDEALATEFAFNHGEVLKTAYNRLKAQSSYTPIAALLLDKQFTILEFKTILEYLLEETLDNSRFRDRIQKSDVLIGKDEYKKGNNRPAQLFELNVSAKDIFYPKSLTKPTEKK